MIGNAMQMASGNNANDPKVKNGNTSSSRKKRRNKFSAIQKLHDTCKEVFADCGPGIVPSPENVERLKNVLDSMTEADVGMSLSLPFFIQYTRTKVPIITYLELYECDQFSIGIFCLPPKAVIPLHNHPGMTVFSKLLFGTMKIKAYDFVDTEGAADIDLSKASADPGFDMMAPDSVLTGDPNVKTDNAVANAEKIPVNANAEGVCLAKLKVNREVTAPCDTAILYPADGGNIHCFRAKTPCCVLDVLGPPYQDLEGRHCQYYSDFPFTKFPVDDGAYALEVGNDKLAWLMAREKPEDVLIFGAKYNGPKIVSK